MEIYEKMLAFLVVWTLVEGTWVLAWPAAATALTQKLFPKWGSFLAEMDPGELRKLGAVELGFGLLLGGYLVWAM